MEANDTQPSMAVEWSGVFPCLSLILMFDANSVMYGAASTPFFAHSQSKMQKCYATQIMCGGVSAFINKKLCNFIISFLSRAM